MNKFIYIFDEFVKNEMLQMGYVLVHERISPKTPWVFENREDLEFKFSQEQYVTTDILSF